MRNIIIMSSESRLSQSEENYIKAIYSLSLHSKESVSTNLLAEKMSTKASSVTDMLKKLSDKDLLTYKKYQGCNLSASGKKIALSIVRKHRLWECFLVDKLEFGWDEVHEIAEQLEHIQSMELINKLDEFLGFPSVDPHGDPIPDKNGKFLSSADRASLKTMEIGSKGVIIGVEDGSSEFLQYLNKINVSLGSSIEIKDKLSFDGSLAVVIDGKECQFSQIIASKIFIQVEK